MARLQIGNRTVEVDDSFLSLSPQDQQATVDEIEASLGAPAPATPTPVSQPTREPAPYSSPPATGFAQGVKVGAQGVGKGMADIIGAPGDLLDGAINAVSGGYNAFVRPAAGMVGADLPEAPRADLFGGSDEWSGLASQIAEMVGYDTLDPETEMTPQQRLGYSVNRYGGQAAMGAAGLTKAAAGKTMAEAPAIMQPYLQNAPRAFAGDVGGGVGTGAAMQATDEYAPESVSQNPLARALVAIAGGVAGSSVPTAIASPMTAATAVADRVLPSSSALKDPISGSTPTRKTANDAAAFMQSKVTDPGMAEAELADLIRFSKEAGGPMPTAGMSGDAGLRLLEKKAALTDPQPFVERYEGTRRAAFNDASRLQNEQADKMLPKTKAVATIDEKLGQGRSTVTAAEGGAEQAAAAEKALADIYRAYAGGASDASIALDKAIVDETMRPMQGYKNELFDQIDPNAETYVPAEELMTAMRAIEERAKTLPESMRGEIVPQALMADLKRMTSAPEDLNVPMMPFKTMTGMRPILSAKEQQARMAGQFPMADSIKSLKKATGNAAEQLAATGGEAGTRAKDAVDFYKNEFAPVFGQGEGKKLRDDVNRDDLARTRTPPSKTASRFLNGGPEAAADLQRIIKETPDPKAAQQSARSYVLDSLSKSVIGADGKISETGLQRWVNQRKGMLDQMPELSAEVDGLLKDVRSGSAKSSAMKTELEKARGALKQTEEEVNRSALSLYVGRDPDKAAAAMLSSGDPVAAIKEVKAAMQGDKAAEEGLKAAFADNLVDSISTAKVEDLSFPALVKAMRKNEAALKEVFGEDVTYLQQARRRLEMLNSKDIQAVAGSGTIENRNLLTPFKKPYEIVSRMLYGALTGGSMTRKFNLMAEQLPDSSEAANELVKRALLDPRVAKHLLGMPVKEVGTPRWNAKLNRLMGWTAGARVSDDEE